MVVSPFVVVAFIEKRQAESNLTKFVECMNCSERENIHVRMESTWCWSHSTALASLARFKLYCNAGNSHPSQPARPPCFTVVVGRISMTPVTPGMFSFPNCLFQLINNFSITLDATNLLLK